MTHPANDPRPLDEKELYYLLDEVLRNRRGKTKGSHLDNLHYYLPGYPFGGVVLIWHS